MKTEEEIFNTMAYYCSQSERNVSDVANKLKSTDLSEDSKQNIIERLKDEKFIDEKRYCRSFVTDKFRLNHWGRIKIYYELKQRKIAPETVNAALEMIDEEEYRSILEKILKEKQRLTKGKSTKDLYQKLFRFAASRGFESNLINDILKKILKSTYEMEDVE
jgi:regulatory protein